MASADDLAHEERFGSLESVLGREAWRQVQRLRLCVIGIGGVGSWVAEALARTGVGALTLVDGDVVSRSNINRQCHSMESTVGQRKVEVMQQRIRDINPACDCRVVAQYLDDDNLPVLLGEGPGGDFHGVVDAIDRIRYKAALIHHCKRNKIPVVTTGGAGGLVDPGRIAVADLAKTWNDPLAAAVRLRLRQRHGFSRNLKRTFGVPCVFSTEQQRYPGADGQIGYRKPGVSGLSLDCRFGYGSMVAVTASFGFQASSLILQRALARLERRAI